MQSAITFNELEWRSDALGASAGRVISNVTTHSKLAFRHYKVLSGLHSTNGAMTDLLEEFTAPDSIQSLESAPSDKLSELGKKLLEVHNKVRTLVLEMKSTDLGFWRKTYQSSLKTLETRNLELHAYAQALLKTDSPLILLSKEDQAFLLASVSVEREPNEALRRASARR